MAKKELEEDVDIDDLDSTTDPLEDDDLFNDNYNDDFFGETATPPIEKHKDLLKDLTNFSPYLKVFNFNFCFSFNFDLISCFKICFCLN